AIAISLSATRPRIGNRQAFSVRGIVGICYEGDALETTEYAVTLIGEIEPGVDRAEIALPLPGQPHDPRERSVAATVIQSSPFMQADDRFSRRRSNCGHRHPLINCGNPPWSGSSVGRATD